MIARALWPLALLLGCGGAPATTPDAPPVVTRAGPGLQAPPDFQPSPLLTEPRHPTGQLLPQYRGEEQAGGHFETAVRYLNADAREPYRAHGSQGRLVDTRGRRLNPGGQPGAEGAGVAIFVVDAAGNLYIAFEQSKGTFHHSSLVAGAPVATAGEMTIFDGQLMKLSNVSGHYRPPPRTLRAAVGQLRALGVDLGKMELAPVGVDLGGAR
jgi:hypothetical protein